MTLITTEPKRVQNTGEAKSINKDNEICDVVHVYAAVNVFRVCIQANILSRKLSINTSKHWSAGLRTCVDITNGVQFMTNSLSSFHESVFFCLQNHFWTKYLSRCCRHGYMVDLVTCLLFTSTVSLELNLPPSVTIFYTPSP